MPQDHPAPEAPATTGRVGTVPIVLLAAGLGTRFGGGVKPLAPVGPDGEPLLLVALAQAARAGFERAIVVTGSRTRQLVTDALAAAPLPVVVADQDAVGPPRATPWGTAAAVVAAAPHAGGADVVVANGDDLYGTPALRAARQWVESPDPADALLVAYPVASTLSAVSGVSRALVTADGEERLQALTEQRDVRRLDDGRVTTATGLLLAPHAPVSMNLWAFRRPALHALVTAFDAFTRACADDPAAEYGLPQAVSALLGADALSVAVLRTDSPWHGVTFLDDVPGVRAALAAEAAHPAGSDR